VLVFCFLAIFRNDYISKLWMDPLGVVMLGGLLLLMIAGWLWMKSVVRIEV
jgi:Flp pilus assembly protein TadB